MSKLYQIFDGCCYDHCYIGHSLAMHYVLSVFWMTTTYEYIYIYNAQALYIYIYIYIYMYENPSFGAHLGV